MEDNNNEEIEKRKKRVVNFLKKKKNWTYYLILSFIVFISVYIRTRNIPKLRDITTGTWTLGPDLDPYLFLRWAKYIVEHGKLFAIDPMRYVPLGYDTLGEMKLLSYFIAWFHKFLSFFSLSDSVTYSSIIFPVFMFALTIIAFFLFARKIFYKESNIIKNTIALVATTFFVLIPSLLPRTIAGIPEKESMAFFFMFLAFYLFLEAITRDKLKIRLIFGFLAGIMTGLMALVWGGFIFLFFTIPVSILFAFLLGKIKRDGFLVYSSWLIASFMIMIPFSERYRPYNLVESLSTNISIGVFLIILMSLIFMKNKRFEKINQKIKIPGELLSVIISVLILIFIVSSIFGVDFLSGKISQIKSNLIQPQITRFGMTVAENQQPYFEPHWKNSFGPIKFNILIFFWLFFIGAVALFNTLLKPLKNKERTILTFCYLVFLISFIFSRYSQNSVLNGVNTLSLLVYFGGWLTLFWGFGYLYYRIYKEGDFFVFKELNLTYIIYFMVLTLGIIGARGGNRLIMVLGAISPVAAAFLIVKISQRYILEKDKTIKFLVGLTAIIIIIGSLFVLWTYYQQGKFVGENFAPGPYEWQWQKTMSWVRENTSQNAVFAHWWDYGYWIQSIGERATILDGGNAKVYWNYLMGRHVLTEPNEKTTLEFLYTHNATHLLIDSTDIGKYTAYSSIGSDENYERFSWISTFLLDESQIQETKNETVYPYMGGFILDEDLVWKENGRNILLPKKQAGVGAIILKGDKNGEIAQPEAIFVYNGNQYRIPLRYAYYENNLKDFGSGLDAGIFTFSRINPSNNGLNINKNGALLYLSEKTIHSQLARSYLFNQKSDYFKLVHVESSSLVDTLKGQGVDIGEFVEYMGFNGPIKIWEINYPSNIELNKDFLSTEYPEKLNIAKRGEYT